MRTVPRPLLSLTARDLMSTTVVTIPKAMSLQGAARLLSRAGITGAPVVDLDGRCVGVVSATDFLCWAERCEHAAELGGQRPCCVHSPWQMIEGEPFPVDQVADYMTVDPVTAGPGTSIGTLAQRMRAAHIHRIIVVDEQQRPVGVVSSTDMLAALAEAGKRAAASDRDEGEVPTVTEARPEPPARWTGRRVRPDCSH
jgi:CBS domain-containing protein